LNQNSIPKKYSLLNDVLGPVMRGPSSSHTAGSYRIASLVRSLNKGMPRRAQLIFHPSGSYGQVYREQGVDLAFAAGFLDWPLTDERFPQALEAAGERGLELSFQVQEVVRADHPNFVRITTQSPEGTRSLVTEARSTGGGAVQITRFQDWPVDWDGKRFLVLAECPAAAVEAKLPKLQQILPPGAELRLEERGAQALVQVLSDEPAGKELKRILGRSQEDAGVLRECAPVFYPTPGTALFSDAGEMVALAEKQGITLGDLAFNAEARLLGVPIDEVRSRLKDRYKVMRSSAAAGLKDDQVDMALLRPSAGLVFRAVDEGRTAVGGLHARAAARALAVMHICNSRGVVCAAPTGGSAGVVPGVAISLAEHRGSSEEEVLRGLAAAGAVGVIVAQRATFAAETAGCQVEIGAAGAMAAAAVVEMCGGTASQAVDAAAISFQNTMGSVCDLVQGMCEIPCHTRNAAAASSAFVNADLIMGGYQNPIPLDETVDAVMDSGRMLPPELRVTSRGGLALAPSARRLPNLRRSRSRS